MAELLRDIFAQRLRELRENRELSQEDVAKALDVSWRTVSRWEQGQATPQNLDEIAELFGIEMEELVSPTNGPRSPSIAKQIARLTQIVMGLEARVHRQDRQIEKIVKNAKNPG